MTDHAVTSARRAAVMIVDDDPQAIEILAEALGSDYDICFAMDGAQTLKLLDSTPTPELILLDMLLPDTDGYALYGAIKARAPTRDVPVIFVTSVRDAVSEAKGLELGAADYITKPISPAIVRARVRNHVELARTRTELIASRNEAMAAARAKAAFLATMSHEIRTPLNGVIGMTGLLAGTRLDPQQRDFVDTIRLSGDALLTLLNDILDFSKIDSGRMDLTVEPLAVHQVVEDACEILAGKAREKKLELVSLIMPDVPPGIYGDAARLRQILINLVGNAVKFTARGEVYVEVRRVPAPAHLPASSSSSAPAVSPAPLPGAAAWIEFRVNDSGIGIAPERIHALFEAFTQADSSTTRLYGGTGLGLAICKRLVDVMGGQIGVDSVLGTGSTFYFRVPARLAPDMPLSTLRMHRDVLAGRRVLLAEGHARSRQALVVQLQQWGLKVSAVDTAQAMLAALAASQGESQFDIAIIERQLPDMDSEALVRAVQKITAYERLPLIALSSQHDGGTPIVPLYRTKLLKPVRQAQLRDALLTALGSAMPPVAPVAPDAPLADKYPLHVLVVDDNAVNRKVAELTLIRLGYQPELAEDGLQAVEKVAKALAAGQRHDLVLMDVQMPQLDGLEATRRIKSAHGANAPVVIAMTAGASVEDRNNCFYAGMDDFVSKPVNLKQLQAAIERWANRLRAGA